MIDQSVENTSKFEKKNPYKMLQAALTMSIPIERLRPQI